MHEGMLEPDALKGARPVLRGAGDSDASPPTRLSTQPPGTPGHRRRRRARAPRLLSRCSLATRSRPVHRRDSPVPLGIAACRWAVKADDTGPGLTARMAGAGLVPMPHIVQGRLDHRSPWAGGTPLRPRPCPRPSPS